MDPINWPEGGWSDEEKKIALNAGAISMRFGARVLRTETAAIALVGAIRGQLGWIE
nr:16S rRNA (uracil(1498)-N(3))-methyltransferase [Paenalcaligenes hominis]